MKSTFLRPLAPLLLVGLVAAACGDSDDAAVDNAPATEPAADTGDDMADDSGDGDDMADDSGDDMADSGDGDDMADDSGDDMADDSGDGDDMADDSGDGDDMADDSGDGDDMADDSGDGDMEAVDRTGEVIKVGYVNNEGVVVSLPEFRTGGEVAIGLINESGGVNGATIETVVCLSDASPEGAINCANQLIEEDVVLAYHGIELASEAAINLYLEAGIPYFSSHPWGVTEQNSAGSFLMHSAGGAYAVGPAKTFADLGIDRIAVILEESPASEVFMEAAGNPILAHHGLEWEGILVDPFAPDWTAAIASAQAAGADGIWGQLSEPGCIGMVSAATAAGYDKPVFAGSCSFYIAVLGQGAVGTYTQSDLFWPSTASQAPAEVQAQIAEYVEAMTAAGHEAHIESFAVFPYSAWRAMDLILETIKGPITAESVIDAFANAGETPGWFGATHRCGMAPWPAETSACRSEIAVWQIAEGEDGTVGRVLVGDGFFEAFEYSGL